MSRAEHPFLQEQRPWECATVIVASTASVGHDLAAHVMIAQSHQPSRSVTISRYRRCRGESCRVCVGMLQNRFVEMWTDLQTARHADGGLPGVRIMVRTEGDQSAPPVLLLHGLGRDGSDLSPVGSALADDHWVISPDQRGHGASGRADEYGFEWMRETPYDCSMLSA